MEKLDEILFYELEKSIKTYRQFAQKNLTMAGFDITIDQWLVLKTVQENSDFSQQQIAEKVFKDVASITRITEILVQKQYITRSFNDADRRRFTLTITEKGNTIINDVYPFIEKNRKQALITLENTDIQKLRNYLNTIITNCK
jgi:MarR family transcriptional regulator for hemolysin